MPEIPLVRGSIYNATTTFDNITVKAGPHTDEKIAETLESFASDGFDDWKDSWERRNRRMDELVGGKYTEITYNRSIVAELPLISTQLDAIRASNFKVVFLGFTEILKGNIQDKLDLLHSSVREINLGKAVLNNMSELKVGNSLVFVSDPIQKYSDFSITFENNYITVGQGNIFTIDVINEFFNSALRFSDSRDIKYSIDTIFLNSDFTASTTISIIKPKFTSVLINPMSYYDNKMSTLILTVATEQPVILNSKPTEVGELPTEDLQPNTKPSNFAERKNSDNGEGIK